MEKDSKDSCLSCKLISISCLLSIGSYLIYTARNYKGVSKRIGIAIGSGTICLGIGEIFNKSPFRKYKLE